MLVNLTYIHKKENLYNFTTSGFSGSSPGSSENTLGRSKNTTGNSGSTPKMVILLTYRIYLSPGR